MVPDVNGESFANRRDLPDGLGPAGLGCCFCSLIERMA